ncbi:hypothetical protein B8W95_12980, partial [Staphylococcus pasteuri]
SLDFFLELGFRDELFFEEGDPLERLVVPRLEALQRRVLFPACELKGENPRMDTGGAEEVDAPLALFEVVVVEFHVSDPSPEFLFGRAQSF